MKEIDFLPRWYKSSRRRQIGYRTQYVILGCVFVVMILWNSMTACSISDATAELAQMVSAQAKAENMSLQFRRIRDEVTPLKTKASALEEIDSKIDVASILAELSFLIDEKVVLTKVEFCGERFVDSQAQVLSGGSTVRVAGAHSTGKESMPLGDIKFRIAISGVASDASDAAELVCKLEDSPYFCQVMPSFSGNKKIQVQGRLARESVQVSEFKIDCYLANFRQRGPFLAKGVENIGVRR